MKPISRRRFTYLGLAGLAAPFVRPARAAPRNITTASLLAADKPETLVWHRIRDLVEERLPGRFRFRIVPNAALGGEREVAEGMRLGSVQASLFTLSALSAWVPETASFDMPFLFRDGDHLRRTFQSEVGADLIGRLRAQGFAASAFVNYGARHLLAKEPTLRAGDLRGLRIRSIQSPIHTAMWEAFGAQPTAIPIPETYNALQSGVVDAMDLTISAYAGFRLYEVVPHVTRTAHIWAAGAVAFSEPFLASLAVEEQDALRDAASEGAGFFDEAIVADEARSVGETTAAGAVFHAAEALDDWARAGRSVWPQFAEAAGGMERLERIAQG